MYDLARLHFIDLFSWHVCMKNIIPLSVKLVRLLVKSAVSLVALDATSDILLLSMLVMRTQLFPKVEWNAYLAELCLQRWLPLRMELYACSVCCCARPCEGFGPSRIQIATNISPPLRKCSSSAPIASPLSSTVSREALHYRMGHFIWCLCCIQPTPPPLLGPAVSLSSTSRWVIHFRKGNPANNESNFHVNQRYTSRGGFFTYVVAICP